MISSLNKTLNRAGTAKIRKLAKRKDYFNALWKRKHTINGKEYYITGRRDSFVWVSWSDFGKQPPKEIKLKFTVGEFVKLFELSR